MTSNTLSILPEFEVFQFLIVLDLFIAFNLIPKKTPEVLFTSYMAFVLPTLYTRGSGNLTKIHMTMITLIWLMDIGDNNCTELKYPLVTLNSFLWREFH